MNPTNLMEFKKEEIMATKLVVLEGIDGSGKSTQCKLLEAKLWEEGKEARVFPCPSRTFAGGIVRQMLKDGSFHDLDERAKALLMAADFYEMMREVKDYQGVAILDRYWYSGLVAHTGEDGIREEWIRWLYRTAPTPDMAFCLYCNPEEVLKRKKIDREANDVGRQNKLRNKYFRYLEGLVHFIEADKPQEEVFGEIWKKVSSVI